jgi:hypothetical protein
MNEKHIYYHVLLNAIPCSPDSQMEGSKKSSTAIKFIGGQYIETRREKAA